MKIFEVHITGEQGINEELDDLGYKNIIVELLKPDLSLLRTEYMSSFITKHKYLDDCVELIYGGLDTDLNDFDGILHKLKSKIIRVKIESPYYEEYVEQSKYIETHYIPYDNKKPLSRNVKSGKVLGTDREYRLDKYDEFRAKYSDREIELCLLDTYVEEDHDWMSCYEILV